MAVKDSPTSWVNEHIQKYVETNGAEGHEWRPGVHTLLLTTKGRKSGEMRRTALIYQPSGDDHVVVASQGGKPTHPAWYLNLEEEPVVDVQVAAEKFQARARTAGPDERDRLWKLMTEVWPDYDDYQRKTDREIPVVVLERISG
ncbi:nitroreductase family deazaflavin-dependent oxidoreductase [Lentzea sp. BCCO 10_0061]|uniref:Nitroreductase family deazaflavin-dependent oxidoreductase n=1 Tax=Lentzea sokolovensis TaxID=3095429 RepID=A0ABU4UVB6_9PSEU|nr:nitroreductase family deazaflavin-dependent oxidoreductase [Lentzea sp. BCCO 10_0061]MDX8143452.1 nitroreductase family deazaflavin-dependent oxidoreductase [Lentzea sp. BCCO 10_0061]